MKPSFLSALDEAGRHLRRLEQADARLPSRITGAILESLEDEGVAVLDQFLFRFLRLQDCLGMKLLRPYLVEVLREPMDDLPFRDSLDRLERLGVIPSSERWEEIRRLRNVVTHDYPEAADIKAARMEEARAAVKDLAAILARITADTERTRD
jgi:DnaJ-domain-containing protein 1